MTDILLSDALAAGFVPDDWAEEALMVLRAEMPILRLIARDTDFEPAFQGKTLNIPYPGTFTAQDKAEGTPVTPQAPTGGATVQLTLSKHKVVDFLPEDFANAQANRDLMRRYMEPATLAIVEAVTNDIFSQYSSLQAPSVGTLGTGINAAAIRSMRKTLNDARAPRTNRSIIVGDSDEIAILGDSELKEYFAFSRNEAIAEGSIGRVYGFDIYSSQLAPVYAPASQKAQTVSITGGPTGGSFTLTYEAQTTAAIPWNATALQVESALAALSTLGKGKVRCSGGPLPGTAVTALIIGDATPTALTHTDSLTGGTSPAVAIANVGTSTAANFNLAFHRDAMIFASRPFREIPPGYGVVASTMTDPETGLSIRVLLGYDIANRGMRVGLDILYGVRDLRPSLGLVALS